MLKATLLALRVINASFRVLTDSAAMLQSEEAQEEAAGLANEARRVPGCTSGRAGTSREGGLLQQAAGMRTCRLGLSTAAGSGAELRR